MSANVKDEHRTIALQPDNAEHTAMHDGSYPTCDKRLHWQVPQLHWYGIPADM